MSRDAARECKQLAKLNTGGISDITADADTDTDTDPAMSHTKQPKSFEISIDQKALCIKCGEKATQRCSCGTDYCSRACRRAHLPIHKKDCAGFANKGSIAKTQKVADEANDIATVCMIKMKTLLTTKIAPAHPAGFVVHFETFTEERCATLRKGGPSVDMPMRFVHWDRLGDDDEIGGEEFAIAVKAYAKNFGIARSKPPMIIFTVPTEVDGCLSLGIGHIDYRDVHEDLERKDDAIDAAPGACIVQ